MKETRMYSLFEIRIVDGKRTYERASDLAFTKTQATTVFQNRLLHPFLSGTTQRYALRALKPSDIAERTL